MTDKERAIQALKFVKVETHKGHLKDLSIAMLIVEMERRGVKLAAPPLSASDHVV